jgi:hypothetical protein
MRKNPNRWDAEVAIVNGKMILAVPLAQFHRVHIILFCRLRYVSYYELL